MKTKQLIIAVAVVLLCAAFWLVRGNAPEVGATFSESDASTTNKLMVGDIFAVELPANPSTGYSWHCTIDKLGLIALQAEEYIAPKGEKDVVGAPGRQRFEFKALGRGSASITFEYFRPWEKEDTAQTLTYIFDIQ